MAAPIEVRTDAGKIVASIAASLLFVAVGVAAASEPKERSELIAAGWLAIVTCAGFALLGTWRLARRERLVIRDDRLQVVTGSGRVVAEIPFEAIVSVELIEVQGRPCCGIRLRPGAVVRWGSAIFRAVNSIAGFLPSAYWLPGGLVEPQPVLTDWITERLKAFEATRSGERGSP